MPEIFVSKLLNIIFFVNNSITIFKVIVDKILKLIGEISTKIIKGISEIIQNKEKPTKWAFFVV